MKKPRYRILAFLLLWPALAGLLTYTFASGALVSVLMFFGVPSLVICWHLPRRTIMKAAAFSALLATPSIIVIDYIAHVNGQWLIPHSILPWRLFTFVSLEVVLWAVMNGFVVVAFYALFIDRTRDRELVRPRLRRLTALFLAIFLVFVVLYAGGSVGLHIPYFYLLFGTVLILIPIAIELSRHPMLLRKFIPPALYFFYLSFVYEIVALHLGWWRFPGTQYVGWVSVARVRFPLEEFAFWLMLLSMAILSFYEAFDDDNR